METSGRLGSGLKVTHYTLQCGHRILPICAQHRAAHTNQRGVRCRISGTVTGKLGKTAVHTQRGIFHLLSQVGTQGQSHPGFQKHRMQYLHIKSVSALSVSMDPSRWLHTLGPVPEDVEAPWLLVKLSHGRHCGETGKRRAPPTPCTP